MAYSWPIWHHISNCQYNSNKSYGNRETGDTTIYVGSSASNSHEFLNHSVTKRRQIWKGKNVIVFRFYVEDVCLKISIFEDNKGRAGKHIKDFTKMNRIKSLSLRKL